jgi:hypothetical protein
MKDCDQRGGRSAPLPGAVCTANAGLLPEGETGPYPGEPPTLLNPGEELAPHALAVAHEQM